MLIKLALRNVRRQVGNYLIYFMTVALTVAMLFAVNNIIFSENLQLHANANTDMQSGLTAVVVLISIIVAFVLSYATAFMLRLRKREFGTYLTLGMTRKNVLAIFVSETMIICVFALGSGLALGLFLYQGLSVVLMNLLEMEFTLAAYSVQGLQLTIGLVIGIFVLASLTSTLYLKRVSIYDLLHGETHVEKAVMHPLLWFLVTLIAFGTIVGSIICFDWEIDRTIRLGENAGQLFQALIAFAVALILFHIGLAKSLIYVLLRRKKLRAKGTNTFVLRQLSGTLSSNALMLGFLAFLLTFAVIGANVSFTQKASQAEALDHDYPYNIRYASNYDFESTGSGGEHTPPIPPEEAEALISQYVTIENKISLNVYTTGHSDFYDKTRWSGDGYEGLRDSFMRLSDFNALITPLGYEPVQLDDQYMIVSILQEDLSKNWADFIFEHGGKSYTFHSVRTDFPRLSYVYFYVVVPDEMTLDMAVETEYVFYDTTDGPYDAFALKEALRYPVDRWGETEFFCDYTLREYGRQQENQTSAILVIGALFVAAVFLMMAMAILSLKTLSNLTEDRQRYAILFRLGASRQEQCKTLFRQTFSFFMAPFAVPMLISIPVALICRHIMTLAGMPALLPQVTAIAAVTAGCMLLVYLLYYAATYLIAKRTVVRV